jgi:ABC-2 type transport system ATP-binding protein
MELEIKQIEKNFGRKKVLEDITLSAAKGTCIGILGENGCGKSTLLSILSGVLKADAGRFLWQGRDLLSDKKLRSGLVGYVPQGTPLLQELTAMDNLRLWYECAGQDLQKDLKEGVPCMLGVTDFLNVTVNKMSGGMKKRLSISCAVAHRPEILLLDEPSAALDLICKERISNYFMDYKRQGGILLLATHDVQELPLCDQWYIMKGGKLVPYQYDGNIHTLVGKL